MSDKTVTQRLYREDIPRLKEVIIFLTKQWGHQASMADAVNYLLDQENEKGKLNDDASKFRQDR